MDWALAGNVVFSGIVIVFAALVILIFLVWAMGKIIGAATRGINSFKEKRRANKAKKKADLVQEQQPAESAPITAAVVEDGIEEEVVAAIMAAVSMMMDGSSPYTVKSIRRAAREGRPAWAMAGMVENTRPF
ncbi:OadG family protein [Candidatus Soleaferrea massiliensis]|uniref:OadG family protein n=1 Tax=Candidatus Soleaferrea massiliensis TaxID=1470354 RepID=UPI00058CC312|nr:OadG family protein [Candidatus Soleaferrea massiliensis]